MNLEVIAQTLGVLATLLGVVCYLRPGRRWFLRISAGGMVILAGSYWLLGAEAGAVVGLAGAACCTLSSNLNFQKPELIRRVVLPSFFTLAVGFYVANSELPVCGYGGLLLACFILGRLSDWMRTDAGVRWMMMPVLLVWMSYSVGVGAWGATLFHLFLGGLNVWVLVKPGSLPAMLPQAVSNRLT